MIKTLIMLGLEGNYPVWHRNQGLAKNLSIAKWLFTFCGWRCSGCEFPDLAHIEEVVECLTDDSLDVMPYTFTRIFVLGTPLELN